LSGYSGSHIGKTTIVLFLPFDTTIKRHHEESMNGKAANRFFLELVKVL